jgi:hypothetical protein
VLGGRVYLNRDQIEIPEIHRSQLNNFLNHPTFRKTSVHIY